MNKLLFVVFSLCALSGCAAPSVVLVHPRSWETTECSAIGTGLVGAYVAETVVDNCVKQYEALGFVRAENLTEEQRASIVPKVGPRLTPPQIHTKTRMKLGGNAPSAPPLPPLPPIPQRPRLYEPFPR